MKQFLPIQLKTSKSVSNISTRYRRAQPLQKESQQGESISGIPKQLDYSLSNIPIDSPIDVSRNPIKEYPRNTTSLPGKLKAGIERLSGISMDDVRVHYNSSRPAEVQALAYTQGTDIHVGSGQERHLPHEAWHVVQQKQGRVKPNFKFNGAPINNDRRLEREADMVGSRLTSENHAKRNWKHRATSAMAIKTSQGIPIQRKIQWGNFILDENSDVEDFENFIGLLPYELNQSGAFDMQELEDLVGLFRNKIDDLISQKKIYSIPQIRNILFKAKEELDKEKKDKKKKKQQKRSQEILTGGETNQIQPDDLNAEEKRHHETMEQVNTNFRILESAEGKQWDTQKQFVNERNHALFTVTLLGLDNDNKPISRVMETTTGYIDFFSSGDAKTKNALLRPEIVSIGLDTEGMQTRRQTREASTIKKRLEREEKLIEFQHGLKARKIIGDREQIKQNFMASVNAEMSNKKHKKKLQPIAYSDASHRHSEQVVKIHLQGTDEEIAEWVQSQRHYFKEIQAFHILLNSERSMCNNCAIALNHYISHPSQNYPITWQVLKDSKVVYLPNFQVSSRVSFNANPTIPLDSPHAPVEMQDSQPIDIFPQTIVGAPGFQQEHQKTPQNMRSLVSVLPPTKRKAALRKINRKDLYTLYAPKK